MYVPRPSPHSLAVLSCPAESYQSYEWPLTPEGTLASLSCELGYAGAITRMCLVGGTWNTTVDNTCTQLSCPLDGDWNVTVAGVNATLACAEGYSGSRTRFCSYSGIWEDENNECVQTMCLPTTISGFSFPAQEPNTTATLSCPLGFSGTVSYTCTEAMTWTDFVNNCGMSPPSSLWCSPGVLSRHRGGRLRVAPHRRRPERRLRVRPRHERHRPPKLYRQRRLGAHHQRLPYAPPPPLHS